MKFRIDEWHRRYPGHIAANQYMFGTPSRSFPTPHFPQAQRYSYSRPHCMPRTSNLRLSVVDRIASLERELSKLKNRNNIASISAEIRSDDIQCHSDNSTSLEPTACRIPSASQSSPHSSPSHIAPQSPVSAPSHQQLPIASNLSYAPPHEHNFAISPKAFKRKKGEWVDHIAPPVYDKAIALDIFNRTMSSEVELSHAEITALSANIHSPNSMPVSSSCPIPSNFALQVPVTSPTIPSPKSHIPPDSHRIYGGSIASHRVFPSSVAAHCLDLLRIDPERYDILVDCSCSHGLRAPRG